MNAIEYVDLYVKVRNKYIEQRRPLLDCARLIYWFSIPEKMLGGVDRLEVFGDTMQQFYEGPFMEAVQPILDARSARG